MGIFFFKIAQGTTLAISIDKRDTHREKLNIYFELQVERVTYT